MDLSLGRNSSIYDYKTACNAPAQSDNTIPSTDKPKVVKPEICPGQRLAQSHLVWHVQPAANCQPRYCWEDSQSKLPKRKKKCDHKNWARHEGLHLCMRDRNLYCNMVIPGEPNVLTGSFPSVCMATPLCKWQDILIP